MFGKFYNQIFYFTLDKIMIMQMMMLVINFRKTFFMFSIRVFRLHQ